MCRTFTFTFTAAKKNPDESSVSVVDEEAQSGGALEVLVERAVKRAMDSLNSSFQKEIKRLQASIESIENLLADVTPALKAMLNARVSPIEKIDALKSQVSDNLETINSLSAKNPEIDRKAIQTEIYQVRLQANKGITLANENEQYSRRNNLRIQGLAPAVDKNNFGVVMKFSTENLGRDDVDPIDVIAIYPLPPVAIRMMERHVLLSQSCSSN